MAINNLTTSDHLFGAALLGLSLVMAVGKLPKGMDARQRWAFYRQAWFAGAALAILPPLVWLSSNRPVAGFGLTGWAGAQPMLTAVIAAIWAGALALLVGRIQRGSGQQRLRAVYSKLAGLMPADRDELYGSWGAGVSAGLGEEIAYRGFLLWYATSLGGLAAGVLLTTAAFGVSHAYQSRLGVLFASCAGLILALAYLASGSLLLVMWMHATYNVASFTVGRMVLASRDQGTSTVSSASANCSG